MSLLEQDITRKGRVDEKIAKKLEFEAGDDNEDYKMEGICNSADYTRELKASHVPGFYYLISWKSYPKNKST